VEVVSFAPGGELVTGSGTSFAAPHVAGTAALLLSLHPELSRRELVELLTDTAKDLDLPGPDPATGRGLVDAGAALERASSTSP
jgi:subtilisin family serine protease